MAQPDERFLSHLIAKMHDHFLSFLNDLNDSFHHFLTVFSIMKFSI